MLERVAEVALDVQSPVGLDSCPDGRAPRPASAATLGLIERAVGMQEQVGGVLVASADTATPTLALIVIEFGAIANGASSTAWMRKAICSACSRSAMSSHTTRNSSPAIRASVSPGRRALVRRCATAISSRSPTRCPYVSLTP